ncbi:MAG: tetratricopeptide repeat protein [Akkermansiaceae bacterium]|nr:tetratricopeptide repeat protein [Akkermansiaceae bacterium]
MGAFLALAPCALAQESTTARAKALYRQGLIAMEQGQIDTARTCFREVLRLQPRNVNASYQLKQLELRRKPLLAKKRQLQMKSVRIPSVDFDAVTLPDALDALNALVEKQTKGKFVPNFIIQDPEGILEKRRFSLKLGAVPASIVLQYALDNTRATARYDEHAIVVRPVGKSQAARGPEGGTPEKSGTGKSADPF